MVPIITSAHFNYFQVDNFLWKESETDLLKEGTKSLFNFGVHKSKNCKKVKRIRVTETRNWTKVGTQYWESEM